MVIRDVLIIFSIIGVSVIERLAMRSGGRHILNVEDLALGGETEWEESKKKKGSAVAVAAIILLVLDNDAPFNAVRQKQESNSGHILMF